MSSNLQQVPSPREGVRRLASDKPSGRAIVELVCQVAGESNGLEFPGRRIYDRALPLGIALPSNLRTLVSYGILKKVGPSTARGAYYTVTDLDAVADELTRLPPNGRSWSGPNEPKREVP